MKGLIAGGFCDFYCMVGPKLAARVGKHREGAFLEYMGDRVEEDLIWGPTTPVEVEGLCRGLEPGKGKGWDGVSPRVIREVAREVSGPLSHLFNCCIRGGFYPGCFKVARVVPVFKGEDPTEFANYRPVSVLPVLSQIQPGTTIHINPTSPSTTTAPATTAATTTAATTTTTSSTKIYQGKNSLYTFCRFLNDFLHLFYLCSTVIC